KQQRQNLGLCCAEGAAQPMKSSKGNSRIASAAFHGLRSAKINNVRTQELHGWIHADFSDFDLRRHDRDARRSHRH
ncbi:MAG: hypothetical protein ACKO7R_18200, partial [Pseudanabaena sp.]